MALAGLLFLDSLIRNASTRCLCALANTIKPRCVPATNVTYSAQFPARICHANAGGFARETSDAPPARGMVELAWCAVSSRWSGPPQR